MISNLIGCDWSSHRDLFSVTSFVQSCHFTAPPSSKARTRNWPGKSHVTNLENVTTCAWCKRSCLVAESRIKLCDRTSLACESDWRVSHYSSGKEYENVCDKEQLILKRVRWLIWLHYKRFKMWGYPRALAGMNAKRGAIAKPYTTLARIQYAGVESSVTSKAQPTAGNTGPKRSNGPIQWNDHY